MELNELKNLLKDVYPTDGYVIVVLDEEVTLEKNDILRPNLIHYETDGGKIGSTVEPRKFSNTGILLKATNDKLAESLRRIYERIKSETNNDEHKDSNIKVTLRDKCIIENLKLNNTSYENVVIANVADIRLIHLEKNN